MTPTELLQPRVLAIGTEDGTPNYPRSEVKSGDILTLTPNPYSYITEYGVSVTKTEVDDFPSHYRPLEWWEMREPEQMPEYVKQLDMIHPSKNWELVNGRWRFEYGPFGRQFIDGKMQPATNEQYIRYVDAIRGFPNS